MKLRAALVVPALFFCVLLSWPLLKVLLGEPNLPALLPLPEKIQSHRNGFTLRPTTRILADASSQEAARTSRGDCGR